MGRNDWQMVRDNQDTTRSEQKLLVNDQEIVETTGKRVKLNRKTSERVIMGRVDQKTCGNEQ